MSRIRSVHPGLFTDEGFASVSMAARMLIIGIWTEAWDDGVFEWKPLTLKMRIFPADSLKVEPLLDELVEANVICAFDRDGKRLGAIRNFCKFQRPQKPNSSGELPSHIRKYVALEVRSPLPLPNQYDTSTVIAPQMEDGGWRMEDEVSTSSLRSDVAASPSPAPRKASRAKPRTQISEDAQPTPKDAAAAEEAGLNSDEFRQEWRKFRNHHRSKGNLMADWQAAWLTWLGYYEKFGKSRAPPDSKKLNGNDLIGNLYWSLMNDERDKIGANESVIDAEFQAMS